MINKKNTKRGGFTLIELCIVIAVLGILVALAVPALSTIMSDARLVKSEAAVSSLNQSLNRYIIDNEAAGTVANTVDISGTPDDAEFQKISKYLTIKGKTGAEFADFQKAVCGSGTLTITGGTVAAKASDESTSTDYKAGVLGINSLLKAVPGLDGIAKLSTEQIANIDSSNMSDELWLKLAKRVNSLAKSPKVDGIVITHGTDTMEETAYFLNLVSHTNKAIVLTGAMRPASAISADGAKNLYNAVYLAADEQARNKGVMIAINDKIYAARDVSKTHTLNIDAFKAQNSGEIGYVLHPDFWGKGYACEAARCVIDFGFERLGLHRIEARFMMGNEQSLRVMEKLGMRFEGYHADEIFVKGCYKTIGICAILAE